MAIRIMLVEEDENQVKDVKQYFSSSSSIEVVKTITKGKDVLNHLNDEYDILVLNMLLSDIDSLLILSKLRELNIDKKVIVTSEFISPDMMSCLGLYNPNYFLKKPYQMSSLENSIISISNNNQSVNTDKSLKLEITNLLHQLGIPSHIKGYNYIRDSIAYLYEDPSLVGSITKQLYPQVAINYHTTSSRVERAIRHAIEVSWMRGDYQTMEEIFGNSVDFDRSKPTNSEFIVTLADRLKLQKKYV